MLKYSSSAGSCLSCGSHVKRFLSFFWSYTFLTSNSSRAGKVHLIPCLFILMNEKKKKTSMSLSKNVLVTPEPESWINVLITTIERNGKSLLKNLYFWLIISNSMLLAKYFPINSTEATIDKKMAVKEEKVPCLFVQKWEHLHPIRFDSRNLELYSSDTIWNIPELNAGFASYNLKKNYKCKISKGPFTEFKKGFCVKSY